MPLPENGRHGGARWGPPCWGRRRGTGRTGGAWSSSGHSVRGLPSGKLQKIFMCFLVFLKPGMLWREIIMKVIFVIKCIWEIRTDNPSLAVKILNVTHRPILPSQKAWLEMASDYHSRIFTTLLPQIFLVNFCILCSMPSYKHSFSWRALTMHVWAKVASTPSNGKDKGRLLRAARL